MREKKLSYANLEEWILDGMTIGFWNHGSLPTAWELIFYFQTPYVSTAVLRKAWRLSMWKILSLFVFCFVLLKRGWACFDMLSGIGNSSGDLPQSEITQEFSHLQRAPKTKIIFEWWFSYWNIFAAFEDSDDHEFCLEFSLKLWPQLRPSIY